MDAGFLVGCFLLTVIVVVVGFLASAIRIVPQYQRIVVFRFGSCIGQKGPGIVFLYPFGIDRAIMVDLREEVREVPHQTNITKDNASIGIDFLIYWQVNDAVKSVLEVNNFRQAALGIATTTLRAVVTEALGTREAAVTVAEGNKQAAILSAEGKKQSAILEAEGQRAAQVLVAEGFAVALDKIFETAKTVDAKTMTLQYFETLKAIGSSPSTKYIFPLELSTAAQSLAGMVGAAISK